MTESSHGNRRMSRAGVAVLIGLALLGASVSIVPLGAAAVAMAILLVGMVARIPSSRLSFWIVVLLLLLTPLDQWLSGMPLGPLAPLFVVSSDALVLVILILLPALFGSVRRGEHADDALRVSDAFLPAIGILVVAGLSFVAHRTPTLDAVYWVRTHLRFVPVGVAVALLVIENPKVSTQLLRVVVGGALAQGLVGVVEYVGGRDVAQYFWPGSGAIGGIGVAQADTFTSVGEQVVAGTLGHYNILGAYVTLAFCILVGARSLIDDRRGRWSALVPVFFVFVVLLTQSRQSIGALLASAIVVMLISGKEFRRVVLVGVLALTLIGSAALSMESPLASEIISRFEQLTDENYWQIVLSENRGFVVTQVVPAAVSYDPVLGAGPGSFGRSFSAARPVGEDRLNLRPEASHYVGDVGGASIVIQIGLLGLAAFLWLLLALARNSATLLASDGPLRGLGVAGFGAIATLLVTNLASSPFTYKATSAVFWLLMGLVAGSVAASRRDQDTHDV